MLNLNDGQKAIRLTGSVNEFVSHRYYLCSVIILLIIA
jgi:hypothetical protein